MPRLTDIDRFKRDLAGLAREPEVLERWGEVREDPPLPEGADVAPSKPPAPAKVLPKTKPRPEAAPPVDEGLPPDFATLLADLPLDAEAALAEAASEPPPSDEATDVSDLDLDSLAPPSSGDLDLDALLESVGAPEPGQGPAAEEAQAPEMDSGLVDLAPREEALPGLDALDSEAPGGGAYGGPGLLDDLEEAPPELEPEPPLTSPEEGAGEALQGLADFDLPADAFPEEAQAEAVEAPEDFSMPDLGDFAAQPDAADAEAAAADTPDSIPDLSAEAEAPAPAEPPSEPGSSLDSFSIDDFAIPDEAPATPESSDAFDGFSLDGIPGGNLDSGDFSTGGFDAGGPGLGGLGGTDLDSQLAALGDEVSPAANFNLDKDWGAGFEVPGEVEEKASAKPPPRQRPESEPTEKVREVALTEAQVDRLQDRLLSFPLNLRLAVEDSLANEKGTEAQRSRLVWAMVERKPFEDVAKLVSKIQKRRIVIPSGYEKSTGADFQAEQGSFRYLFAHTILPILKTGLIVLIAAAILGFLGWKFIYTPMAADALYRSGYARIGQDRYAEAEASFTKARAIKEMIPWYYRYAEAYAQRRQYLLAERKYEDLLKNHPGETRGALAWAGLERDQLKYKEGVRILQELVLQKDYLNKDGLLLQGDIYLEWADEDPSHFEDARRCYATLIQNYGMEDAWLERMLLYFMRTDKLKEVLPLKTHFLAVDKLFPSASTLAELGGYLFDKGILEDVRTILMAAQAKEKLLPEAHYNLARYFLKAGMADEERKALGNAIMAFGRLQVLTPRREAMFIDSWIRRANAEFATREYIAAESDYSAAVAEYAKALELGRIRAAPRFAAAFAGMGQVAYWQRDDLSSALTWFEKAAAEGFDSPELRYERGYIHYRQARIPEAVEQFYLAGSGSDGQGGHESPYLLFAFGNALYARKDWSAAEAYYRRTVDAMEAELEQIDLPVPSEKASHAEIEELLMEARNNLGAALLKASTRTGDARKRAAAVLAFTDSTKLYDNLGRDQAALRRAGAKNLGLENINILLEGGRSKEPLLYTEIERGMAFPRR